MEKLPGGCQKWLSANKLKLNPDKTEFIVFGSKIHREKLKSFPVNILGNFLSPVGAVRNLGVWFDSEFSFSKHVQNIFKSCFAQIRDLKRLRGYLTHHAALMAANALVGNRLVITCLGVSQFLIFVICNVFKIVWLELSPTPPSTHTSLLLGRLTIGCLLIIVLYSRLPYWCTSSYIVVIQNILHLFLNPDKLFITHAKAKLMVCSMKSPTLPLQYISLLSILASVLLMTLQRFGMIYLMMYFWPLLSTHSKCLLKTYIFAQAYPPCFHRFLSMVLTLAMSQVYDYSFLLSVWHA